jgi:hypothetical protein
MIKKILLIFTLSAIITGCSNGNANVEGTTWTGTQNGLKITVKFMKNKNYITDSRGDFVNITGGKYAVNGDTIAFVALGRKSATYAIVSDDSLFALENGQKGFRLLRKK